jgi:glycosyltransferase involved in cell wall biosynthesis
MSDSGTRQIERIGSSANVLQLVADGNAGGATTVVLDLALELRRREITVTIASNAGSYLIKTAKESGIPVLELDFTSRLKTSGVAAALTRHVRDVATSVIHAHGCRAGLPAAMTTNALGVALIYTVHGFHFRGKPIGVRHLAKTAERHVMNRAATTVFVSRHDARVADEEKLIAEGVRFQIIRNGSQIPQTELTQTAGRIFDIAFVGRVVPVKNVLALPRILAALRPMQPTLCIIGGGESEAALRAACREAGVADQVTFLGTLPHTQALSYLRRSRVMILPSRSEGMPVSAIEAMHHGVPVVASRVGGTPEVVVDGQTGYLVEVDNIAGYALCLRKLLSNEGLRRSFSEDAIARARKEFSLERQLAEYVDLYSRTIGMKPWRNDSYAASGSTFSPPDAVRFGRH